MQFFFQNLGYIKCFSITKSFKTVLFENSKSVRFRAKSLKMHHFEENIHFGQKMNFELDITPKSKLFLKFVLNELFFIAKSFKKF